jgi:Uma2 family endonuclease
MSIADTKTRYTPEDLLTMPDGDRYELVDGELVERNMSTWSSYVAGQLFYLLLTFCRPRKLGWVYPEGTSYECFPAEPGRVRKPDDSFIRLERLSVAQAQAEGHLQVHPDLAAEVVSPNDRYYEVEHKVQEWLRAGTQLVWVINPQTCRVRVYRADGSETTLRETDELSGENVVPGFRCRVSELFLAPADVPASS